MILISNISVAFGGRDLFRDMSFQINPKDKIGLAGKNGVGKSTLLKIIAGQREPTKGHIVLSGNSVGYLPQELKFTSNRTVMEETLTAFDEVNKLEAEMESIHQFLAESTDYESENYLKKLDLLQELTDRFNYLGGHKKESNVERFLKGLGFKDSDFTKNINNFSGGWQMRVELAKLLLISPDLLLLDEPTNHLDIESIIWVEEFLKQYPGAIMMVSHDRTFLDSITGRTVEISNGNVYDFNLPYSKYLEAREEMFDLQKATYDNQQKYIADQERLINRFRSKASKASMVQSRIKRLEKMDRIELDEIDTGSINFRFPPAPRSGGLVLETKNLVKKYDDYLVLDNLEFAIQRGERVAFVGKNGEGKTTLSKIIAGVTSYDGVLNMGHNVELGYYAQIQEKNLDENKTVYEIVEYEATGDWANQSKLRGLLGAFLFKADDVDKKVKVLSGGEKSRLAMARLLLRSYNLLVLDEPTNHLDIYAKEILKEALQNYDGTLIIVSHDRDFLKGLTSKTFEFKDKKITEHLGDITDFLDKHKVETFREFEKTDSPLKVKTDVALPKEPVVNELSNKERYQLQKEKEKEIRKIQNAVQKLEEQIALLEKQIRLLEIEMHADGFYNNPSKVQETTQQHKNLQRKLEQIMYEWEIESEKLDGTLS